MNNDVYITDNRISKVIVSGGESDSVSVYFTDEEYAENKVLEVFLGDVFETTLPLLPTSSGLKVVLAGTLLNGSTLNVRIKRGNDYGQFYHFSIDKDNPLSFTKYNGVCCGNRWGAVSDAGYLDGRNTYKDLSKYTYGQLSGFTNDELRRSDRI
jgi:hypothetical protein